MDGQGRVLTWKPGEQQKLKEDSSSQEIYKTSKILKCAWKWGWGIWPLRAPCAALVLGSGGHPTVSGLEAVSQRPA